MSLLRKPPERPYEPPESLVQLREMTERLIESTTFVKVPRSLGQGFESSVVGFLRYL